MLSPPAPLRVCRRSRDLSLTVHHHGFATGQSFQVDMFAPTVARHFEPVVNEAFFIHSSTYACLPKQVNSALFKNACANAGEDVIGVFAFDDDVVDASVQQQVW